MSSDHPPLPLGTQTPWGEVVAVGLIDGERYYWLYNPSDEQLSESVAFMPASVVEAE